MSKIVRLTESDIEKVVRGVLKEKKTGQPKTINNLMEEVDSMLKFHYKSNIAFLKHTEDFSERFNILENVKTNLVENLFSNNNMILERFDEFSNKGIIMESTFNFQQELNGYFNFVKTSLLYQIGFINESQYGKFILLNEEESFFDSAWNYGANAVNTVVQGAKDVGNTVWQGAKDAGTAIWDTAKWAGGKVVDVAKQGYDALQGAWNKLKSLGVGAFMEKFRGFLVSNYGAALQILIEVSTEGFGALIPVIAWAILANYDIANVIAGTPDWFNVIFSLIGVATTGIASKAIGAAMPLAKSAGKAASSLTGAIQWLAKSKFGQMFKSFASTISKSLSKVPGLIAKAMTWIKSVFGKVFGEGIVTWFQKGANAIGKYIGEMATSIKRFFGDVAKQETKKSVVAKQYTTLGKKVLAKNVNKVVNKAATLSPKLEAYLATTSGKQLTNKLSVKTVDIVKKEINSNLKDYTEEQAFAYIDKKYGKLYGDLLRFAKSANDVKNSGQKVTKNTKNFYKSVSADRAATNYKDIVTNTEKLAKNTGKTIDYGNQVASNQSVVGNVGNVMNNVANAANKSIAKV
jgi:hypothetical protein